LQRLPKKFRAARPQELARIMVSPPPDLVSLLTGPLAPPWVVRRSIRLAVYGGPAGGTDRIPDVLRRYPEFAAYLSEALLQSATHLPMEVRARLSGQLANLLLDTSTPDFASIRLMPLLGSTAYRDRSALAQLAERYSTRPKGLMFRTALDALRSSGGIPEHFQALYVDSDKWVRRALIADRHKSPTFVRRLRANEQQDPFLKHLAASEKSARSIVIGL
jgi:hypothetical protein